MLNCHNSLLCIEDLAIYIFDKRQGKTLGILTVAGSALSSGVGTAGSVLLSTAKVVGGLKTLALLGIGTSELNFCFFHFLIHHFNFILNVVPYTIRLGDQFLIKKLTFFEIH